MKASWILTAAFFLWAWGGPVKATISCQDWNTESFFEHAEVADVSRCLEAGAEVNTRSEGGWTPLHIAARYSGTPTVLEVLLDAGAKVDARTTGGKTPLHFAAAYSDTPAVLEALLGAGAEVDARAQNGVTPLHTAAAYSKTPAVVAVVAVLLDAGADPVAKDGFGETPWDLAQKNSALKGTNAYWRLNEERFQ